MGTITDQSSSRKALRSLKMVATRFVQGPADMATVEIAAGPPALPATIDLNFTGNQTIRSDHSSPEL